MKNKKLLYILAPLVVILWGIIFYRIFSSVKEKNNYYAPVANYNNTKPDKIKKDVFYIVANYRDPFIRKKAVSNEINDQDANKTIDEKIKKTNPRQNSRVRPRRIRWPNVEYKGSIYSNEKNQWIAIVNINQKSYLMYQDETSMEITLLKIYEDSIRIQYSDVEKTIAKSN